MDEKAVKSDTHSKGDIALGQSSRAVHAADHDRMIHALEAADQGVWDQRLLTDNTYYSPVWWHMRGYAPDSNLDNSMEGWLLRVHPDDREHVRNTVAQQNLARDENCVFEYRERHAQGHYIWIQSRGRSVAWDKNGNATRTLGTDTDITLQKQLEIDVATERERLRVMLGSIADAVIATDANGTITYMNPSAVGMVQGSADDCMGKQIESVFSLSNEDNVPIDSLQQCRLSGARWENKNLTLRVQFGPVRDVRCVVSELKKSLGANDGFIVVMEDVSLSRQLERRLAFLANHDALTRLPNRHAFEATMKNALLAARDENAVFSLCSIDLDRFKQINDTLGHAAGDHALQKVVMTMNRWKIESDYIARIGGDEFIILMRDTTAQIAERRMSKLEQAIENMNCAFEGRAFGLGLSFGIAQIRGAAVDADQILRLADSRCYAHKTQKRFVGNERVAS